MTDQISDSFKQEIIQGFASLESVEVSTNAAERLAEYGSFVASSNPEVWAAASQAFTARVVKTAMAVLLAAGIVFGAYVYLHNSGIPLEDVQTPTIVTQEHVEQGAVDYIFEPQVTIAFYGGGAEEHINPTHAVATTTEGTITQWAVFDGTGSVVTQGEGDTAGASIPQLASGSYTIFFYIEDGLGATATAQRDFTVG